MKTLKFLNLLLLLFMVSCDAIRVNYDYDKTVDFSNYKTYAFYKTGIDQLELSDLDKKRILTVIDEHMTSKGFTKSETADILINFNTKAEKNININQYQMGFGWGWGFNPFWGNNYGVSMVAEGTLTIDFIDSKKRELIWQGEGIGNLTQDTHKKDENIKGFVTKILAQYPPIQKN